MARREAERKLTQLEESIAGDLIDQLFTIILSFIIIIIIYYYYYYFQRSLPTNSPFRHQYNTILTRNSTQKSQLTPTQAILWGWAFADEGLIEKAREALRMRLRLKVTRRVYRSIYGN